MSRVGKKPIPLPKNTSFSIHGNAVKITGPKGTLKQSFFEGVQIEQHGSDLVVSISIEKDNAQWGTARALLANMVKGVNEGFVKILEIHGIGYKAKIDGKNLVLEIGYSHPVRFPLPDGVEAAVAANEISIHGIDKQIVGNTAAHIRQLRPPEPYKGKGIRYKDEKVRRKAGKVVKSSE